MEILDKIGVVNGKLKESIPGFKLTMFSGYFLVIVNMLAQFLLAPFYLNHLGEIQFGILMMILNILNLAALGIGWVSGGLVREFGTSWASKDLEGFRSASACGKYLFTGYALCISVVGVSIYSWLIHDNKDSDILLSVVLYAGAYFVFNYEALSERIAFKGIDRQATGNFIESARVLVFILITFMTLSYRPEISTVIIALLIGLLLQRVTTAFYWHKLVGGVGWKRLDANVLAVFKRLTNKQGQQYLIFGAFVLLLQSDVLLIGFIAGPELAAQFVLLWKIPEAIGLILWRIPSSLEARVIQLQSLGKLDELANIFYRGRRYFILVVSATCLLYGFCGEWLAHLWVGDFARAGSWMYVASAIALFLTTMARWPISFGYAMGNLSNLLKLSAIEYFAKLILILLFIEEIGVATPILATIFVHSLYIQKGYQTHVFKGVS